MEYDLIIDAHVHTFKTREIGLQALQGAGKSGLCGTPDELLEAMDAAGIRMAVQANVTPARSMYDAAMAQLPDEDKASEKASILEKITGRVKRRNEWTCKLGLENSRFVPLIAVDPLMGGTAIVEEMEEKAARFDVKGLKIHPAEGRYFPDDPSFQPAFETAQKLSLPVLTHGGDFAADKPYARPENFRKILKSYPDLVLIIAHMGSGYLDESLGLAQEYDNVYFDTSAFITGVEGHLPMADAEVVELIRNIGTDRVMFASDYPWFHPGRDLKRFLDLDFSDDEKRAILGGNAKRVYDL